MRQQRVVIVAHEGVSGLELAAATDLLAAANLVMESRGAPPAYDVCVLSLVGEPVRLSGGLTLNVMGSLVDDAGPVDFLLVLGGMGGVAASENLAQVHEVRRLANRAQRIVSLCTGAFTLAAAGLLDGRRATTHWNYGALLQERSPLVTVDVEPIFIRDGPIATSAGVTAGIDLLLALIEDDLGTDVARRIAAYFVMFLRRTGNQSQFSVQLRTQFADRQPIRELQQYIADHPHADLSSDALAERLHMSPRHLARLFREEVGTSPGKYVEDVRIEVAKRRLEESDRSVTQVAAQCGFGSVETLRRVFVQRFGVAPNEYRRRFGGFEQSDGLDRVG